MEDLLRKIKSIVREEKLLQEAKTKRGENFNIFKIMNAENNEVNTHSAILAELLNPKGVHGCNDAFLKLFIEMFVKSQENQSIHDSFDVDTLNLMKWHVYKEYSIGLISEDKEHGGRIDIIIESDDKKKTIIIENKINAGDQEKQLIRYRNYAKRYSDYLILYLTLDGHEPDNNSIEVNESTMKVDEDFYLISYGSFILNWLQCCKEKASSYPLVRETITQYYNLIKSITKQNMETISKEKLVKLLSDKDGVSTLFQIQNVHYEVLNKVCDEYLIKLIKEIAQEMNLKYHTSENQWLKQYNGQFWFWKSEWKNFCIAFEFMGNNLTNFNYGIKFRGEREKERKSLTGDRDAIHEKLGGKKDGWWASSYPFDNKYLNWNNEDTIKDLFNGEIKNEIMNKINYLLQKLQESELESIL